MFDHEAMSGMALTLLIAGHETTANMLSLGVLIRADEGIIAAEATAFTSVWGQNPAPLELEVVCTSACKRLSALNAP